MRILKKNNVWVYYGNENFRGNVLNLIFMKIIQQFHIERLYFLYRKLNFL